MINANPIVFIHIPYQMQSKMLQSDTKWGYKTIHT